MPHLRTMDAKNLVDQVDGGEVKVFSNGWSKTASNVDETKEADDEEEDITEDSKQELLVARKEEKSCFPKRCFPELQSFVTSYRSADPQSRVKPFAVVLLVVISIVYVLNQADRLVLAVLIPSGLQCPFGNSSNDSCKKDSAKEDADVSGVNNTDCIKFNNAEQGLLTGPAFTVIYVLAGLPLAWLADTTSRSLVLLGGIAFWSAMVILMGFIHNFWELLLLRIMLGVGEVHTCLMVVT